MSSWWIKIGHLQHPSQTVYKNGPLRLLRTWKMRAQQYLKNIPESLKHVEVTEAWRNSWVKENIRTNGDDILRGRAIKPRREREPRAAQSQLQGRHSEKRQVHQDKRKGERKEKRRISQRRGGLKNERGKKAEWLNLRKISSTTRHTNAACGEEKIVLIEQCRHLDKTKCNPMFKSKKFPQRQGNGDPAHEHGGHSDKTCSQ